MYDDWSWVSEQNSVEAYRRFLDTFPNHPKAAFLGKRLIDLEVDLIAAGAHGYLPRAAAVDSSPHSEVANMRIENQTEYELTVRFSGVDSKMLVIQKKGTSTIELKAGSYRVAASVAARDVENYYGTDELDGGSYETRFYIKRTSVPGSYPRY